MYDEADLVTAFKEMRQDGGVTPSKLTGRPWLLELLKTPNDPVAGLDVLDRLIQAMGDRPEARAVRNALNVKMEWHGKLDERRAWANDPNIPRDERFLGVSRGTHITLEKRGFSELAQLLLTQSETKSGDDKSSTETVAPAEAGDTKDQSAGMDESDTADTDRRTRRWTNSLLATAAILLLIGTALIGHTMLNDSSSDKTTTEDQREKTPLREERIDNTTTWGPSRNMYSVKSPAPYAAFNSLKDQYTYGDERHFLTCRDEKSKEWHRRIAAEDNHYYVCQAWFSNAVAPNLDKDNSAAQLHNARMSITVPIDMPLYNPPLVASFTADNAPTVWAACNFLAERPISIYYIQDSTSLITKPTQEQYGDKGMPMPDRYDDEGEIAEGVTTQPGALIGESKQDGMVRQGNGWVQFTIQTILE